MERVAVFLGKPTLNDDGTLRSIDDQACFAHGQLYVALSRVGHPDRVRELILMRRRQRNATLQTFGRPSRARQVKVYMVPSRYATGRVPFVIYREALLSPTQSATLGNADSLRQDDVSRWEEDDDFELDLTHSQTSRAPNAWTATATTMMAPV